MPEVRTPRGFFPAEELIDGSKIRITSQGEYVVNQKDAKKRQQLRLEVTADGLAKLPPGEYYWTPNNTALKEMKMIFGSSNSEDWLGKKIAFRREEREFSLPEGKKVLSVAIPVELNDNKGK